MQIKVKANISEIILGAFLVIAVFAMGMVVESSRQPQPNQSATENSEHGSAVVAADKSPNITDWLLVLFNGLLFGSNLLLWGVTRTAADAAKKAAEAADASAKAVTVVERAYVYPVITGHGAVRKCIDTALVFYLGDQTKDNVPCSEKTTITFKLKNFGKTPAILKEAYVGCGVNPFVAEEGVAITESVLGEMDETGPLVGLMHSGITRNQALHINVHTAHFCFSGIVTYYDIWDNEHTTRFYFMWEHDTERMALKGIETKTKQNGE